MNTRWLRLFLFLAVLACGYLVWSGRLQQSEIASLQSKLAAFSAQNEANLKDLKIRLEKSDEAKLKAEKDLAESNEKASPERNVPAADDGKLSDLSKDPAQLAMMHKQFSKMINRQYGEGFAKLNLPADKLAKLKDLLVSRFESMTDAFEVGKDSGLGDTKLAELGNRAMAEIDNEIKTLIGGKAFDDLQETQKTSTYKQMIMSELAIDMSSASAPLTNDQIERLAKIYSEVQDPVKNPNFKDMLSGSEDPATGLNPLNQAILNRAAQVLTPGQLSILKESLVADGQAVSTGVTFYSYSVSTRVVPESK